MPSKQREKPFYREVLISFRGKSTKDTGEEYSFQERIIISLIKGILNCLQIKFPRLEIHLDENYLDSKLNEIYDELDDNIVIYI